MVSSDKCQMAGCPTLRLEVMLVGPLVDEMFSKAGGIGCPVRNNARGMTLFVIIIRNYSCPCVVSERRQGASILHI